LSSSILNFDLKNLKMPSWLTLGTPASAPSGLKAKYPPVALDMGINQVALARLAKDKDAKKWSLTSYDMVEIPEDLLESDFFRMRVRSVDRFRELVTGAMRKEGVQTDRVSMVIPDHLARVALLSFDELPRTRREVIEMVRWKMKKAVPFKVEESTVDYQMLPRPGGGHTLLAVLMPTSILEEHESLFAGQSIRVGLIDLSTFSVAHLYRDVIDAEVPADGEFMLLNATGTFFTVMIFRAGLPIFYRCKTFAFGGDDDPESNHRLIHREIQASLLYYQERLGGTVLSRVYMRLTGHDAERVAALFREAPVATRPELIDVRRVVGVTGRIAPAGDRRGEELLQRLAPAVGAALGREAQGGA